MVDVVRAGYVKVRGRVLPLLAVSSLVLGTLATVVFSGNSSADYFTGCNYGYGSTGAGFGSGMGVNYGYGYPLSGGGGLTYGYGNQVCPPSTTTTTSTVGTSATSTTTTTIAVPPPAVLPSSDYTVVAGFASGDGSVDSGALGLGFTTSGGVSASLTVSSASGALPVGTQVEINQVTNTTAAQALLPAGSSYLLALSVSWTAPDGTSPAAKSPITATIQDSGIKAGDVIYMVGAGGVLVKVGTATVDGSITFSFTQDPLFVVAHASTTTSTTSTTTTTVPVHNAVVPYRIVLNFAYYSSAVVGTNRTQLLALKSKLRRGATVEIIAYAFHDRSLALQRALRTRQLLTLHLPLHVHMQLITKFSVRRVLVIPVKQ